MENRQTVINHHFDNILPEINIIEKSGYLEAGRYGFAHYLSKKLKLKNIPTSYSSMQHGALHLNFKDSKIITHYNNGMFNLVWSKEEGENLKNNKILNYKIVGAPFIYISKSELNNIKRIPNSLLVMPMHTLGANGIRWNEELYIKEIMLYAHEFDTIVFCIHYNCIKTQLWINTLKKYDIPYIIGAHKDDTNSLVRMKRIFNSFEYMTTNSHGSHIYYALYSKCKVSIYGTILAHTEKELLNDNFDNISAAIVKEQALGYKKEILMENYPMLFTLPHKANKNISLAKKRLGHKYKKSYNKLSILLGWYVENYTYSKFAKNFGSLYENMMDLKNEKDKYLLYGNGSVAHLLKLLLPAQIVTTVDKNSTLISGNIEKDKIYSLDNINNINYDYIIITPLNREIQISNTLINNYNIDQNKIILLKPFQI